METHYHNRTLNLFMRENIGLICAIPVAMASWFNDNVAGAIGKLIANVEVTTPAQLDVTLKVIGLLIALITLGKLSLEFARTWNARTEHWWKLWRKPWKKTTE